MIFYSLTGKPALSDKEGQKQTVGSRPLSDIQELSFNVAILTAILRGRCRVDSGDERHDAIVEASQCRAICLAAACYAGLEHRASDPVNPHVAARAGVRAVGQDAPVARIAQPQLHQLARDDNDVVGMHRLAYWDAARHHFGGAGQIVSERPRVDRGGEHRIADRRRRVSACNRAFAKPVGEQPTLRFPRDLDRATRRHRGEFGRLAHAQVYAARGRGAAVIDVFVGLPCRTCEVGDDAVAALTEADRRTSDRRPLDQQPRHLRGEPVSRQADLPPKGRDLRSLPSTVLGYGHHAGTSLDAPQAGRQRLAATFDDDVVIQPLAFDDNVLIRFGLLRRCRIRNEQERSYGKIPSEQHASPIAWVYFAAAILFFFEISAARLSGVKHE